VPFRIERTRDNGPRLYLVGVRVHHGLTGCFMAAVGLALVWHDRRDFPFVERPRRRPWR
jgi:hypothetical protein